MPAKGDGITKRKDGRFMARYAVHTPDGPKRKLIYGRKYKEVERKLAEARGDAARGLVFDADNLKMGEYLDRWLADSVADTVRPTTFERYEQIVRVHIRPALGNLKLKDVTPAHARPLPREAGGWAFAPHRPVRPRHPPQSPEAGRGRRPHPTQCRRRGQAATGQQGGDTTVDRRAGEDIVRVRTGRQARSPLRPRHHHRVAPGRVARSQVGRR